ncbi:MAG: glycosyltransferase [Candidatus Roizmanbacteria bacterium]|nr:glycosyltransferase [Candidatus Roizmanbacteria bacterium]
MNKIPPLSIIIATYGRGKDAYVLAQKCINAVPNCEVIIVEQPVGDSYSLLEKSSENVCIVHQEKANLPAARNRGVRLAKSNIVLFLDDDVQISKQALQAHIDAYKKDNKLGGVAGRVLNENDPKDSPIAPVGTANNSGTIFHQNFYSTKKQNVQFVYGCNMSFKKTAIEKAGYFDEKFPPLFEEIDLSARISKNSPILFEPEALAIHLKKQTGGVRQDSSKVFTMYYQAYGRFVKKHVSYVLLFYTVPVVIMRAFRESGSRGVMAFINGLLN